ncbi:cadmium-sensing regulator CadC [Laceyella sediminis]|uniref:Cadmium-sensing regulator, CadC n=2 Tax=Laceyella TaxID=292635 RepID=A0AA46AF68_9BACL|nr:MULTISPECIES: metalloregulator ArsR/SmtB family transcription factor [Laceyella]PRZ15349.1 cadmium-sensing regulator CadC [Laceyella sediminis]SMP17996.1 cadmium-sensing regulator, CadC [Laceyella tengchongensis]
MSEDRCEIYCYDEEKVKRVQTSLEKVKPMDTAQLFKALADPTRLKIAYALVQEDELCVCDVANIIDSTLATASHHLRLLRNMGLAKYRKEGKLVFYSLDDDHVKQLVQLAFDHSKELTTNGTSAR